MYVSLGKNSGVEVGQRRENTGRKEWSVHAGVHRPHWNKVQSNVEKDCREHTTRITHQNPTKDNPPHHAASTANEHTSIVQKHTTKHNHAVTRALSAPAVENYYSFMNSSH